MFKRQMLKLVVVLVVAFLPRISHAQFFQMEAKYILNFAYFTIWPQSFPSGNFEIYVLGSSEMAEQVQAAFNRKKVMDHPVKITEFKNGNDLKGTKPHIVYVSYNLIEKLDEIMDATSEAGSLVVVEVKDTKKTKPVIAFINEGESFKYAINFPEAQKRNLKFQDQMLKLSTKLPEYGGGK